MLGGAVERGRVRRYAAVGMVAREQKSGRRAALIENMLGRRFDLFGRDRFDALRPFENVLDGLPGRQGFAKTTRQRCLAIERVN